MRPDARGLIDLSPTTAARRPLGDAKRPAALALALLALLLCAAPASADFGFRELGLDMGNTQAGSHPAELSTVLDMETELVEEGKLEFPDGQLEDLEVDMPAGFAGNPTAVEPCETARFIEVAEALPSCPNSTALGYVGVKAEFDPIEPGAAAFFHLPVYNLPPPPGKPARFGFIVLGVPVIVDVSVREAPPYNVYAELTNTSQAAMFYASKLVFWGNPASPANDPYRGACLDALKPGGRDELFSKGKCAANVAQKPFLTSPRSCEGPLAASFHGIAWNTGDVADGVAVAPTRTGCSKLGFALQTQGEMSSQRAESPAGFSFDLSIEDEGILNPSEDAIAFSDIKRAEVTLPEGVTINPSQAEGLSVCSEAQLARETAFSQFGEGCPPAAKIGSVEVTSPLLEEQVLHGSLFVAEPYKNPFGSLLALYMVIQDRELGVSVKLPAKVEPDPLTGQVKTTFGDPSAADPALRVLPQLPLETVRVSLREGARSPLVTPPACGTYSTRALFTPWSGTAPLESISDFQVTTGPDGGPCPQGLPFAPGFSAGTLNNNAGAHSPLHMFLTRRDGDQDLTKFSATLPPGLVAKLAGLAQCPDAALAAARAKSGRAELAAPSCSDSSRIGGVLAGAGVGQSLTYVPGSLYLAGPYKGAPISVAAIVPAVAGPFDVGAVVTRVALRIDPRTAKVTVDGAASDPIPHILAGIPLKVREIRVMADRPQFSLNPTSCDPAAFDASIWGGGANVFSDLDDSPVSRSARFQAANCSALGFSPQLFLKLKGGVRRGAHPALTGAYRPRAGQANLSDLVLRLPRSAFLDQAHIRTICTRVQFAQHACPAAAIYGQATAYTPLLDQPLSGPVYLRSSDHELPDFVADLHGLIDVEAVARIDSAGGGIRATFADVPDAPLTKVTVSMQGAKKGLIVNSTDLCQAKSRADLRLTAHNAKRSASHPPVRAVGCKGKGRKAKHGRRGR